MNVGNVKGATCELREIPTTLHSEQTLLDHQDQPRVQHNSTQTVLGRELVSL